MSLCMACGGAHVGCGDDDARRCNCESYLGHDPFPDGLFVRGFRLSGGTAWSIRVPDKRGPKAHGLVGERAYVRSDIAAQAFNADRARFVSRATEAHARADRLERAMVCIAFGSNDPLIAAYATELCKGKDDALSPRVAALVAAMEHIASYSPAGGAADHLGGLAEKALTAFRKKETA